MYLVSNVPPAINTTTGHLDVYGGLAVAVMDSIPASGVIWAGMTTNSSEKSLTDRKHNVVRLPVAVESKNYQAHYAPWSKGKIYAAFHGLMEYAGLEGTRFVEPAAETEANYVAHINTINDFAFKLAQNIHKTEMQKADASDDTSAPEAVMIHDYQLIELGMSLRDNGLVNNNIGLYLHIPFPSAQNFKKIPHAQEMLDAFLAYNLVGFQEEEHSLRNFVDTVRAFYPSAAYNPGTEQISVDGRHVRLKSFAASIDPDDTLQSAIEGSNSPAVEDVMNRAAGRKVVLSASRFDIIKGIPETLGAVEQLLDEQPQLANECLFVFNLQPAKYDGVNCYRAYQEASLEIAGRIQAKHPKAIHMLKGLTRVNMLGLMRRSDVMHVGTTIEGQNLMVKEYVVAQEGTEKPGVSILSAGCGAYHGLKHTGGIFILNPHMVEDHKQALRQALDMPAHEALAIHSDQAKAIRDWTSKDYGRALTTALHTPTATNGHHATSKKHQNGFLHRPAFQDTKFSLGVYADAAPELA